MNVDLNEVKIEDFAGNLVVIGNIGEFIGRTMGENALSDLAFDVAKKFYSESKADVSEREIIKLIEEINKMPFFVMIKRPLVEYLKSLISKKEKL